jgi:hypothetical protein
MPIIKNGVEVALASTTDALTYVGAGRTKFYEFINALGIKPVAYGNASRWKPKDLDRIVEHIETGGNASKVA